MKSAEIFEKKRKFFENLRKIAPIFCFEASIFEICGFKIRFSFLKIRKSSKTAKNPSFLKFTPEINLKSRGKTQASSLWQTIGKGQGKGQKKP